MSEIPYPEFVICSKIGMCYYKSCQIIVSGVQCHACMFYKMDIWNREHPTKKCRWMTIPHRMQFDRMS